MKKNVSYHMKKLNLPGIEKWLGTFDSLGQTFDSSGECFASLRSEKQLSPSESKVCPLESKVCLTIFPSLASIFHVVGTYIPIQSPCGLELQVIQVLTLRVALQLAYTMLKR